VADHRPVYFQVSFELIGRNRVPLSIFRIFWSHGYFWEGTFFCVKASPAMTSQSLKEEISKHLKTGEKVSVHGVSTIGGSGGHSQLSAWESLYRHQREKEACEGILDRRRNAGIASSNGRGKPLIGKRARNEQGQIRHKRSL
jgi:hypothetical protein